MKRLLLFAVLMCAFACGDERKDEFYGDLVPSATVAETSPASGSEIYTNSGIVITLDESVDSVTVNGFQTTGSGKTWTINLAGMGLSPGAHSLAIKWINKDGTTGSDSAAYVIPQKKTDKPEPTIENDTELAAGRYTLISLEFVDWNDNLVKRIPPEVSGDAVISGNKITLSLDSEKFVWYFEIDDVDAELGFVQLYKDIDLLLLDQIGDYKVLNNGFMLVFFDSDFVEVKTSWRKV